MLEKFDWSVFWSAFGALVSFASLLGGVIVIVQTFLRRRTWAKLQAVLQTERQQYEKAPPPDWMQREEFQEPSAQHYMTIVKSSLLALAEVPRVERKEIRRDLRNLLSELRTTHVTLVESLKPFMLNDAKEFIEGFGKFYQEFGDTFDGQTIESGARTHCEAVAKLAREAADDLRKNDPNISSDIIQGIETIADQITHIDYDIIVPAMFELLKQTAWELPFIDTALRSGQRGKAIWLKERFRFEVKGRYKVLTSALARMDELASRY